MNNDGRIVIGENDSLEKLIDILNGFARKGEYVFRGYGKQDELYPSIIRSKDLREEEEKLLENFEKYGSNYYKANTPIDFMSYAQHFGLPTRLLDFTFNPYIALSFATYNKKYSHNNKVKEDNDFYYIRYANIKRNIILPEIPLKDEIYCNKMLITDSLAKRACQCIDNVEDLFGDNLLDRNAFSIVTSGLPNMLDIQNKIRNKAILFINPNQSNQRIIMQQGLFMFPYVLDRYEHLEILQRNSNVIMIHKNFREDIVQYLDTLGYNAFRLMPDLSSICEAVKRRVIDERYENNKLFKKKDEF